jgi:hypothetical protein
MELIAILIFRNKDSFLTKYCWAYVPKYMPFWNANASCKKGSLKNRYCFRLATPVFLLLNFNYKFDINFQRVFIFLSRDFAVYVF